MNKASVDHKMAQFYVLFLLFCVVIGACGYFIAKKTGIINATPQTTSTRQPQLSYYDLPEMTLNLGGSGNQVQVDISLGVEPQNMDALIGYQPKITDKLNWYFSQENEEELMHPSDYEWIKDEMLRQVNDVGAPFKVKDVLLKRMVFM